MGAVREMLDLIATLRTAVDQCPRKRVHRGMGRENGWAHAHAHAEGHPGDRAVQRHRPRGVRGPALSRHPILGRHRQDDCIRLPTVGHRHVSLTSDKDIAIQLALLGRPDDEGEGHVIAFRRADLIAAGHDLWDCDDGCGPDEPEHEVMTAKPITGLRSLMAWSKQALEDGWGLVGESEQAEAEERDVIEWESDNG